MRNPLPKHVIQVSATIPETLSVRIQTGYRASGSAGMDCQRTVGLAVTAPLHLSVALQLDPRDGVRSASIVPDAYLPGRCNWTFSGIWYFVQGENVNGRELAMPEVHSIEESYSIDIWCIQPKSQGFGREVCGGLGFLASILPNRVSQSFVDSIPRNERGDNVPAHLGSRASAISVQFHDLDNP
jgi:hypothetical protein